MNGSVPIVYILLLVLYLFLLIINDADVLINLLLLFLDLNLKRLNLDAHPLFFISHLSDILLSLLNKILKVLFVLDQCLPFFSMHFNYDFILSKLRLQLCLDGLFCLLFLDAFFHEIKQLILIGLDLPLLFFDLVDLFAQLLLHLLGLKSGFGQLSLETRLHIFLFVGLQGLELIERVD